MNPQNPSKIPDSGLYLYPGQPHKNLRTAHDLGLILFEKRKRRPVNKLLRKKFLVDDHNAQKGKPLHARTIRPADSISPIRQSQKVNSKSVVQIEGSGNEWGDKLSKKVKKEEPLLEGEKHEQDIQQKKGSQEALMPGNHMNRFLDSYMVDYVKLNSSRGGPTQARLLIQKDTLMPESPDVVLEPSGINQNDQERKKESYHLKEESNVTAEKEIIQAALNNEKIPASIENCGENRSLKRKRGRPAGSKKSKLANRNSSPAIATVSAKNNLARIPRELKKVMSASDLKLSPPEERKLNKTNLFQKAAKTTLLKNEGNQAAQLFGQMPRMNSSQTIASNKGQPQQLGSQTAHPSKLQTAEQLFGNLSLQELKSIKSRILSEDLNEVLPQELHSQFLRALEGKAPLRGTDSHLRQPEDDKNFTEVLNELPGSLFLREKNTLSGKFFHGNTRLQVLMSEEGMNSAIVANKKKGSKKAQIQSPSESSNNESSEHAKQEQPDENIIMMHSGHKDKRAFISCDMRYFNLDFLVEKLGYFDIDPPWERVSSELLSSEKATQEYNTLTNQEIMNIRVDKLSHKG